MEFVDLFILFLIGSITGYVLEVIYRNISRIKKINPGFLRGPYLPIYGIVTLILFFIYESSLNLNYKLVLIVTIPTAMELIIGLIFKEYFRIKLWDYSKDFLNFKGIICLKFSIYWAGLSIGYYFIIHTWIKNYFLEVISSSSYTFIYGGIAGIFLLDVFYSFNVAFRIRKTAKRMKQKYISFSHFKEINNLFGNIKIIIEKVIKEQLEKITEK